MYGYRRGGTFDSPKVPKSDLGLRPKNPTHRNARPESQSDGFPDRGLNGAYQVSQMHLPPPNLPRFGGGERPPFFYKPPAPLTITMGQRLVLFASPISLRVIDCRLNLSRPSEPLSRIGKGGGGKGQIRLWLPWERICAQYGLNFGSRRNSIRIQHCKRQKGVCQGGICPP